jgi:hypothetical protein
MHPVLNSALYFKENAADEDVAVEVFAETAKKIFDNIASQRDLVLDWIERKWPTPKTSTAKRFIPSEHCEVSDPEAYEHLGGFRFSSDVAIFLVSELQDVDAAVPHLLFRQRGKLQHVFVITAKPLSRRQLRLANALDIPLVTRQAGILVEPVMNASSVEHTQSSARTGGYLSFHDESSLNTQFPADLLELAHLRKAGRA